MIRRHDFLVGFAVTMALFIPGGWAADNPDHAAQQAAAASSVHFFFLPPISELVQFTGQFDPTLAPEIRICTWANGACQASVEHHQFKSTSRPCRVAGSVYISGGHRPRWPLRLPYA
jgi:hypothetical protein